ncbi:MAG: hypothetical protein MK179_10865 [Pirellulaceae bacterium]|nr:hypothetical protein [Pirellulaceae bacterium]
MGQTLDLGRRIELQSSDGHCADISLGLYERQTDHGPRYLVHTYSSVDGTSERVAFLTEALRQYVGFINSEDMPGWLQFGCGGVHLKAVKRIFLDLCKLPTGASLETKPLTVHDKKADCEISVTPCGNGKYQIQAAVDEPQPAKRAAAVAKGYVKLCEIELTDEAANEVTFACGGSHDSLVGMLLYRAQNVRASMREDEMSAAKGVLSAPSQQDK